MDYLPGQYGMHYERIGLNDYHYDSLGLTGHRPYYAFTGNQLATGEQGSNGNYYWMQQQHSGQHLVGQKQYELTNHLGNVQVTVSDLPYKHGNDTIARISPALKAVYDYYPFGSPMPGRTIMDTARKCVDMTRLDRVWKAWEMTQAEIYTLSLINYHLDGEGKVFIDDNGAVEVEIADEYAVFYMDLQDSLNNGGEMVLHIDWLKEFSEKGFLLTLQGMDATGEMRVFYQKHYEKPEDAVYLNIADSFTNVSVGIQGNLHFGISNIRYFGGSWVNEEVLVRVCDDGGDRYRYGYNTQESVDEIKGVKNHYTAPYWEYDPRVVTRWNRDPVTYPWQSPYAINNNNPIVFTDPLGLFGSRGEAREYKKEHGLKGRIHKGNNGMFSIDNKREGTSLFRDPSLDDIPNLIGRQDDGVIKAALVTPDETPSPSIGDYMAGIGEFGKRGEKLTKTTTPLKSTGQVKYYDNNWGGNQHVKTTKVFNKSLTKIAKKAPLIGHAVTASEIIDGIQADGNAIGANTAIEVAGALGSTGGAWGGATAGALIGSAIFPGVGTVIGGAVGAFLGSWGGEAAAESATRAILKE